MMPREPARFDWDGSAIVLRARDGEMIFEGTPEELANSYEDWMILAQQVISKQASLIVEIKQLRKREHQS